MECDGGTRIGCAVVKKFSIYMMVVQSQWRTVITKYLGFYGFGLSIPDVTGCSGVDKYSLGRRGTRAWLIVMKVAGSIHFSGADVKMVCSNHQQTWKNILVDE